MSLVAGWHVQVQRRWRRGAPRDDYGYSHDRPRHEQLWCGWSRNLPADVDLAIESRSGQVYGDTDIARQSRGLQGERPGDAHDGASQQSEASAVHIDLC